MHGTDVLHRHAAERRNDVFVDGGLGCSGRACLSLPLSRQTPSTAGRVVTGKSGLRASGGKVFAKSILHENVRHV